MLRILCINEYERQKYLEKWQIIMLIFVCICENKKWRLKWNKELNTTKWQLQSVYIPFSSGHNRFALACTHTHGQRVNIDKGLIEMCLKDTTAFNSLWPWLWLWLWPRQSAHHFIFNSFSLCVTVDLVLCEYFSFTNYYRSHSGWLM